MLQTKYNILFLNFFINFKTSIVIYTLSLHDALPICQGEGVSLIDSPAFRVHLVHYDPSARCAPGPMGALERRSELWAETRRSEEHTSELQSHVISYAVFCLKKKIYLVAIKWE